MSEPHEVEYVRWQNRATRFYLGARATYLLELYAPAAFCAQQAIESLLKATLAFRTPGGDPAEFRHDVAKLESHLRHQLQCPPEPMPSYFYADRRYQMTSRYPDEEGTGLHLPPGFLPDLDGTFVGWIRAVPFQHNTELSNLVRTGAGEHWEILSENNGSLEDLKRFLS